MGRGIGGQATGDVEGSTRDDAHALAVSLRDDDEITAVPIPRGGVSIHNEKVLHGSGGNFTEGWRRTYVCAFRSKATIAWEREHGFTHRWVPWAAALAARQARCSLLWQRLIRCSYVAPALASCVFGSAATTTISTGTSALALQAARVCLQSPRWLDAVRRGARERWAWGPGLHSLLIAGALRC